MHHYIIDGNNLIGKIKTLQLLQKRDQQSSREGLVNLINRYFAGKKVKLSLHLDGFSKTPLHLSKGKINYSDNYSADYFIRKEIENSKNPKLLILVSSDRSLINFARVCSCSILTSENFKTEMEKGLEKNEEAEKLIELHKEKDHFLKLFQDR
jgi:predicted RNA-binding protein with PIN domain